MTSRPSRRRASTSSRVTVPFGPDGATVARSTPRSLASLRTGGLASARAVGRRGDRVGDQRRGLRTSAGRDRRGGGHGGLVGALDRPATGPGSNAPWVCALAALAPAATPAVAGPLRARRTGPRSALLRPTRLSPSPPPEARGLERSISTSAAVGSGVRRRPARGRRLVRVADRDDRRADGDRLALGHHQGEHRAGVRRRQLDQRLRGLDLDDDVVDRDDVADLDLPGHDLGLGEALADVGQLELRHAGAPQKLSERSTASSTRSRSGRKSSSIREAGYGVSNPPTRSTGASRE